MKKTELRAPSPEELDASYKQKKLSLGRLGSWFGDENISKYNIAGIVLIVLVLAGIIYGFFKPWDTASEFWKIIVPIITLILGYIFGKSNKE